MRKISANFWLFLLLVLSSVAVYILQIIQFGTPRDTAFYFFQDMAFLPLQVAIVTLVLGKYLKTREKRERLGKLNIAIGAFFSEAGNALLAELLRFSPEADGLRANLSMTEYWTGTHYKKARKHIQNSTIALSCRAGDLSALQEVLSDKRGFLLNMLANPNLLEHDRFTDMLWAVFHLSDELAARENLPGLPDTDLRHLETDIKRALGTLLVQWLGYMEHLQTEYPYLFSLELRKGSLGGTGRVIVT